MILFIFLPIHSSNRSFSLSLSRFPFYPYIIVSLTSLAFHPYFIRIWSLSPGCAAEPLVCWKLYHAVRGDHSPPNRSLYTGHPEGMGSGEPPPFSYLILLYFFTFFLLFSTSPTLSVLLHSFLNISSIMHFSA